MPVRNNAAGSTGVQTSLPDADFLSFGYTLRRGVAGHEEVLFVMFCGSSVLFSIVPVPISVLTDCVRGFPVLRTLRNGYDLLPRIIVFLTGVR